MCRRSVRFLKRIDWLDRLAYRDMSGLPADELPVTFEQSLTGMPMRTKNGAVIIGFPAVRRALRQTPIGCVPAMALYVPGVSWCGRRAYGKAVEHRNRTSRGACAVE